MFSSDRIVILRFLVFLYSVDVNLSMVMFEPGKLTIKFEPADRVRSWDASDEVFLSENRPREPNSKYTVAKLPDAMGNGTIGKILIMGHYYDLVHEPETYRGDNGMPGFQPVLTIESPKWIQQHISLAWGNASLKTTVKVPSQPNPTTESSSPIQTSTNVPNGVRITTENIQNPIENHETMANQTEVITKTVPIETSTEVPSHALTESTVNDSKTTRIPEDKTTTGQDLEVKDSSTVLAVTQLQGNPATSKIPENGHSGVSSTGEDVQLISTMKPSVRANESNVWSQDHTTGMDQLISDGEGHFQSSFENILKHRAVL